MYYPGITLDEIELFLYPLLDADMLPDCDPHLDQLVNKDPNGDVMYAMSFCFTVPGNSDDYINIIIDAQEDHWVITVADGIEKDPGEYLLLGLKAYLSQHPSLQYEDFTPLSEMNSYLLKKVPDEYCTLATVALTMAVQEYIKRNCKK